MLAGSLMAWRFPGDVKVIGEIELYQSCREVGKHNFDKQTLGGDVASVRYIRIQCIQSKAHEPRILS